MRRTARIMLVLAFVLPSTAAEAEDDAPPAADGAKADDTGNPEGSTEEPKAGDGSITASTGDESPTTVNSLLAGEAMEVADGWEGPGALETRDYPWIEHHGYFRLRVEGFYRGHLGTHYYDPKTGRTVSTSGFMPPLTENKANTDSINKDKVGPRGEDWLAGANMRFRYRPTVHLARSLQIHAEFDVLDNLVLGSTPDYHPSRPDAPLSIFARSQAPPSYGRNGVKDSIAVKQAWMSWNIMDPTLLDAPLLNVSAGRMARHWGLGILENDGEGLDADFGTYVDRVTLLARLFGIYFEAGYGWVASGPTSESPYLAYGEPRDLTDADDVTEVTFAVFSKPMSEGERKERFRNMHVMNKPAFDWGLYMVYRRQTLDVAAQTWSDYVSGAADPNLPGQGTSDVKGYDTFELVPRDAWSVTPDVWLRLEWVPQVHHRLHLELEGAAVIGRVGNVFPDDPSSAMDIRSFGAALEGDYTMNGLSFGLKAGFATGDKAEHFGFLDATNIADPNAPNRRLAAFYFNPDYHVDALLFRRVVGTVTNSFYLAPFVQYDFFESEQDALGGRFQVLYGRALEAEATPGNDADLGLETLLQLFYQDSGLINVSLEWAFLWPLGAFDLIEGFYGAGPGDTQSARWSTAIRARVGVTF